MASVFQQWCGNLANCYTLVTYLLTYLHWNWSSRHSTLITINLPVSVAEWLARLTAVWEDLWTCSDFKCSVGDSLELSGSSSQRRSGRDTDKTVLSCLACRCELALSHNDYSRIAASSVVDVSAFLLAFTHRLRQLQVLFECFCPVDTVLLFTVVTVLYLCCVDE